MDIFSSVFQLSNCTELYEAFRTAIGGVEWFVLAYVICLLCFFVIGKEYLGTGFVYPFVFMLLTIFNPFLIIPLSKVIGLLPRIRRLFWLLPVNLVLAFVLTWAVFALKKKGLRVILCAVAAVGIICGGSFAIPQMHKLENPYKTSNMIIEISRIIEEDAAENGLWKSVLHSDVELLELRQYDPSIHSVLRRSDMLDWSIDPENEKAVKQVVKSKHVIRNLALVSRYGIEIKQSRFLKYIKRARAPYVIPEPGRDLDTYLKSAGFEEIGNVNGRRIYRLIFDTEQDG